MVMPSKEKNHVIRKDREQGEQQTIGTRCYTPLSTPLELVPIGLGPGRLLLNPLLALIWLLNILTSQQLTASTCTTLSHLTLNALSPSTCLQRAPSLNVPPSTRYYVNAPPC